MHLLVKNVWLKAKACCLEQGLVAERPGPNSSSNLLKQWCSPQPPSALLRNWLA